MMEQWVLTSNSERIIRTSDEHHQMIQTEQIWKMAYSAFHTQYSNIPKFDHSISVTEEIG